MNPPRALVLNHNLRERGTYFRAWKTACFLRRQGWSVTFATSTPALYRPRTGLRSGIRVWETPSWSPLYGPDSGWSPVGLSWRTAALGPARFDLVYTFSHKPVDYVAARLARCRGAFWVADWCDLWGADGLRALQKSQRGLPGGLRHRMEDRADALDWWLERSAARDADLLTVISSDLSDRARALGRPEDSVMLFRSGADTEGIRPLEQESARRALGLPLGRPILGYVASWHPDGELLATALAQACQRVPDLLLLTVGPPLRDEMAWERLGLARNVREVGRVPFARLSRYFAATDGLLLPLADNAFNRSRWPNKIGDYLAAGKPVLACDVGDIGPFVRQSGCGIACEPDADAFACGMVEMACSTHRRDWGRNALAAARRDLDWDGILTALVQRIEVLRAQ